MKPRDVTNFAESSKLRHDSFDSGELSIVVDGHEVFLSEERHGGDIKAAISIPREHFNRLIEFYNAEQDEVDDGSSTIP